MSAGQRRCPHCGATFTGAKTFTRHLVTCRKRPRSSPAMAGGDPRPRPPLKDAARVKETAE